MRLRSVEIDNYRAVKHLKLPLDPRLTVFHGDNAQGKTSVLNAIAVGLGAVPTLLPEVSGIGFLDTDRRRSARYVRVALETTGGTVWERHRGPVPSNRTNHPKPVGVRSLREKMEGIASADEQGEEIALPIVAFYGADRAAFSVPQRRSGYRERPRYAALEGALSAGIDFRQFFEWFKAKEDEELRDQKRDPKAVSIELEAVRTAITSMIPGASQPRIEFSPLRFVVSLDAKSGGREELTLDQMGGGYRVVLALAADLARRMAQGNPHRAAPCACEAIVLIDDRPSLAPRVATACPGRSVAHVSEYPVPHIHAQPPGADLRQTGTNRGTQPREWRCGRRICRRDSHLRRRSGDRSSFGDGRAEPPQGQRVRKEARSLPEPCRRWRRRIRRSSQTQIGTGPHLAV